MPSTLTATLAGTEAIRGDYSYVGLSQGYEKYVHTSNADITIEVLGGTWMFYYAPFGAFYIHPTPPGESLSPPATGWQQAQGSLPPPALGAEVTPPSLKITDITTDGFTLHEPTPWDSAWTNRLAYNVHNSPAEGQPAYMWVPSQGFSTKRNNFATSVSDPSADTLNGPFDANIIRVWKLAGANISSGYQVDDSGWGIGNPSIIARPPVLLNPTRRGADVVHIPLPVVAPCVTNLVLEMALLDPTSIWTDTTYTVDTVNGIQVAVLEGRVPGTTYRARWKPEFPATGGGDGYSTGASTTFSTRPRPPVPVLSSRTTQQLTFEALPDPGDGLVSYRLEAVGQEQVTLVNTTVAPGSAASVGVAQQGYLCYWVATYSDGEEIVGTDDVLVYPSPPTPGLQATAISPTAIRVIDPVSAATVATGIAIEYRDITAGGDWVSAGQVSPAPGSEFVIYSRTPEHTYEIMSRAVNSRDGAFSGWSGPVTVTTPASGGGGGTCTYTPSASNVTVPSAGGSFGFSVDTQEGCQWSFSLGASWIHTGSTSPLTGDGSVSVTVDANLGPDARSTTYNVQGQTFTVTQAAPNNGGGGDPGGGGSTPPSAPEALTLIDQDATALTVELPALPANATYMQVQAFVAGSWQQATGTLASLAGGAQVTATGFTTGSVAQLRAMAFNAANQTAAGPALRVKLYDEDSDGDDGGGGTLVPEVPSAPRLGAHSCSAGTQVVQSPLWAASETRAPTSMKLFRSDKPGVLLHIFSSANDTFTDEDVSAPNTYSYSASACNAHGCSAPGAALEVLFASEHTVAFESPVADATLRELHTIVVRVSQNATLSLVNPVSIFYNGAALPGVTRSPGDARQFSVRLPAAYEDWQGPVTLGAQLTDAQGCPSMVATRQVLVASSLLEETGWGDVGLVESLPIEAVQVDAVLDPVEDPRGWEWEFAVASPPPADSPPPANPTPAQQIALEQSWALMQKVAVGADEVLLGARAGDGSYTAPTNTAICRVRRSRPWKRIVYPLGAPVTKLRVGAPGEVLIYALPFIYKLSTTGFERLHDLSPAGFNVPNLLDASVRGARVLAVAGASDAARVLSLDLDAGQVSAVEVPWKEERPARRVEVLGEGSSAHYARIYGDASTCALYESWVENGGLETRKRAELVSPVTRVHAAGERMALATLGRSILTWKKGETSATPRHTHDVAATFVRVDGATGALWWGDVSGRLWELLPGEGERPQLLAALSFPVRSAAPFRGGASDDRFALAGDDNHIWMEDAHGIARSALTLGEDETVSALENLLQVLAPGTGSPLLGGTASVTLENLLAGVDGPGGSYLLRYQKRASSPLALPGAGLAEIAFAATLLKAQAEEAQA